MRKIYILLTVCCALIACKKNDVDFSYSPQSPKAGESVSFLNLSTSGEEWAWSFGDGATATMKSPAHVFKRAGIYRVTLKVDNNSSWVATKDIEILDTVPSFTCEDSTFVIYQDYTFKVLLYNPYSYTVEYEWTVEEGTEITSIDDETMKCYFTVPNDSAEVRLKVTLNGEVTEIAKKFFIEDKKTNSLLLRTAEADYRQRIFGERAEEAIADKSAAELLDAEDDTKQTYNGYEFTLAEVSEVFPGVQGFHIASRKIYYRVDGLWVANIDGTNSVQIDSKPCTYMTLDTHDNRIYWANADGVWYMPFVGSDNNKFVTVPVLLNEMNNVTKLTPDYTEQ